MKICLPGYFTCIGAQCLWVLRIVSFRNCWYQKCGYLVDGSSIFFVWVLGILSLCLLNLWVFEICGYIYSNFEFCGYSHLWVFKICVCSKFIYTQNLRD